MKRKGRAGEDEEEGGERGEDPGRGRVERRWSKKESGEKMKRKEESREGGRVERRWSKKESGRRGRGRRRAGEKRKRKEESRGEEDGESRGEEERESRGEKEEEGGEPGRGVGETSLATRCLQRGSGGDRDGGNRRVCACVCAT